MSELISPKDEPTVRLLVFGAALLAIAMRRATIDVSGFERGLKPALEFDEVAATEARFIADAVVQEAKRLQEHMT